MRRGGGGVEIVYPSDILFRELLEDRAHGNGGDDEGGIIASVTVPRARSEARFELVGPGTAQNHSSNRTNSSERLFKVCMFFSL